MATPLQDAMFLFPERHIFPVVRTLHNHSDSTTFDGNEKSLPDTHEPVEGARRLAFKLSGIN